MQRFNNWWNNLPRQRRIVFLSVALWACVVLATLCLLRKDGVREVLYQAF